MIDEHELRIGNLVLHGESVIEVENIFNGINGRIVDYGEGDPFFEEGFSLKQLLGIPLTEDWLVRLGVIKDQIATRYWTFGHLCFHFISGELYMVTDIPGEDNYSVRMGRTFQYVHEFQNLIHALTGEELTIKEK